MLQLHLILTRKIGQERVCTCAPWGIVGNPGFAVSHARLARLVARAPGTGAIDGAGEPRRSVRSVGRIARGEGARSTTLVDQLFVSVADLGICSLCRTPGSLSFKPARSTSSRLPARHDPEFSTRNGVLYRGLAPGHYAIREDDWVRFVEVKKSAFSPCVPT